MAATVRLTADFERFAHDCVDSGRYSDVSEVVHAAMRLLQDAELNRRALDAMLDEARHEARHAGAHTIGAVAAEIDAIIAAAR